MLIFSHVLCSACCVCTRFYLAVASHSICNCSALITANDRIANESVSPSLCNTGFAQTNGCSCWLGACLRVQTASLVIWFSTTTTKRRHGRSSQVSACSCLASIDLFSSTGRTLPALGCASSQSRIERELPEMQEVMMYHYHF